MLTGETGIAWFLFSSTNQLRQKLNWLVKIALKLKLIVRVQNVKEPVKKRIALRKNGAKFKVWFLSISMITFLFISSYFYLNGIKNIDRKLCLKLCAISQDGRRIRLFRSSTRKGVWYEHVTIYKCHIGDPDVIWTRYSTAAHWWSWHDMNMQLMQQWRHIGDPDVI